MTIKEIYENVSLKVPLEQRRFIDFFNNTADELESMFHTQYVANDNKSSLHISSILDNCNIKPLYHVAIIDNILYLSGSEDIYKSEFARKAQNAYLKYWEDISKNKIRKRADW